MRRFAFALCALAAGCATYAEPPPNYDLSWAKRGVAFESFVADVDACNASAEIATNLTPPRRGNPENDEIGALIWFWRWLATSFDADAAMAEAYDACLRPRGYFLIYVTEEEALAFRELPFTIEPGAPFQERLSRIRETQLRHLHRLAIAPRPLRAHLEPHQQRRALLAFVRPVGPQASN